MRLLLASMLRAVGRACIRGAECAYRAELREERRLREATEARANEWRAELAYERRRRRIAAGLFA